MARVEAYLVAVGTVFALATVPLRASEGRYAAVAVSIVTACAGAALLRMILRRSRATPTPEPSTSPDEG